MMDLEILSLRSDLVQVTKELIAEVVLEFYGDFAFLPKSKPELLIHYEKTGYLRDLDEYQEVYSAQDGAFLVVSDGADVIGCGGLRRLNQNEGELVRLWFKKEFRKRGLGRTLFQKLIRLSEEKGYSKVYLDTSHRCVDAIRLFRNNGFEECGKYKDSVGDIFMCRKFPQESASHSTDFHI